MFRLVNDMGFQLDLPNGYTVSVMFSPFAMCGNKKFAKDYVEKLLSSRVEQFTDCRNAETAVKNTVTGEFIPITREAVDYKTKETYVYKEDVQGYQNVYDFLRLMNEVRDYPNTDEKMAEVKERTMSNA